MNTITQIQNKTRQNLFWYKFIYVNISFVACCIYIIQRLEFELPAIINNYVNDFLCLPIILGGISYCIRRLKKEAFFKLPLFFIIGLASYYSFYFEYYLPGFNPRYTGDWIDVILYFLSSIIFFFTEKYFYKSNWFKKNSLHNMKAV
jgi:hypothetical protein